MTEQKTEKTVMITVRVPESLRSQFVDIVNKHGQKQNWVLMEMIKRYVQNKGLN